VPIRHRVAGRDSVRAGERSESEVVVERPVLLNAHDHVFDGCAARSDRRSEGWAGANSGTAGRITANKRRGKAGEAKSADTLQEIAPTDPLSHVHQFEEG
jgi:hypothetical protein